MRNSICQIIIRSSFKHLGRWRSDRRMIIFLHHIISPALSLAIASRASVSDPVASLVPTGELTSNRHHLVSSSESILVRQRFNVPMAKCDELRDDGVVHRQEICIDLSQTLTLCDIVAEVDQRLYRAVVVGAPRRDAGWQDANQRPIGRGHVGLDSNVAGGDTRDTRQSIAQ